MTDDIIKSLRCNVDNLCWKFRLKRCRLQKDILMENNLKIVHRITIVVMFTDIFIRIFYFAKKIIIQRLSLRCHSFWIILNLLSVQLTIIFTKKMRGILIYDAQIPDFSGFLLDSSKPAWGCLLWGWTNRQVLVSVAGRMGCSIWTGTYVKFTCNWRNEMQSEHVIINYSKYNIEYTHWCHYISVL